MFVKLYLNMIMTLTCTQTCNCTQQCTWTSTWTFNERIHEHVHEHVHEQYSNMYNCTWMWPWHKHAHEPVLYFILKLFWLCALKNSWRTFVRLYSFKVLGRYFQSDKIFITFSLGWKLHWKLFILFQGEFYEKIETGTETFNKKPGYQWSCR